MSTHTISASYKDGPETLSVSSSGKSITVKYVFRDWENAYDSVSEMYAGDVLTGYIGFYIQSVNMEGYKSADCTAVPVMITLIDDYAAAVGGSTGSGGEEPAGEIVEDSWQLTWQEVSRPFLTHPRFNSQTPYGGVTMTSDFGYSMEKLTTTFFLQRLVNVNLDTGTPTTKMVDIVRACEGADPRLRAEIMFVSTSEDQVKFLNDVFAGIDKGQNDYKIWAPIISHTTTSSGSATTLGTVTAAAIGFIGAPSTTFGLTSSYEFLKTGDNIARTGRSGRWQRNETWQGALTVYGGWSKLTYKAAAGAQWPVNPVL